MCVVVDAIIFVTNLSNQQERSLAFIQQYIMAPPKFRQPTNGDWHHAMGQWKELSLKTPGLKRTQFLASEQSGPRLRNCKAHCNLFNKQLKRYENGELENTDVTRQCKRKYLALETKLINYVDVRAKQYTRDKCGLSWLRLKTKCLTWAKNLGIDEFKCSNGWINDTLKRHGRQRVKLHGEGNDVTLNDENEEDDNRLEVEEGEPVSKSAALNAIDLLKTYCEQRKMGPALQGKIRSIETDMG